MLIKQLLGPVWNMLVQFGLEIIESVQRRSACWIKSSYDPVLQKWTNLQTPVLVNLVGLFFIYEQNISQF